MDLFERYVLSHYLEEWPEGCGFKEVLEMVRTGSSKVKVREIYKDMKNSLDYKQGKIDA